MAAVRISCPHTCIRVGGRRPARFLSYKWEDGARDTPRCHVTATRKQADGAPLCPVRNRGQTRAPRPAGRTDARKSPSVTTVPSNKRELRRRQARTTRPRARGLTRERAAGAACEAALRQFNVEVARSSGGQLVLPLPCNDAASYVLSTWRVASCGYMQEQHATLFLYDDAASYVLSVWRVSSSRRVRE